MRFELFSSKTYAAAAAAAAHSPRAIINVFLNPAH